MEQTLTEAVERILTMEQLFDRLSRVTAGELQQDALLVRQLRQLKEYYCGGQWLSDYSMDEQGLLPRDLKRGVLSQDGVQDLLTRLLACGN